jgi:hypothetical protein
MRKFLVGDPCYHHAFKEGDNWMKLLESSGYFSPPNVLSFNGRYVGGASTLYGDGEYPDNEGNNYPVDSGLIGFVEYLEGDEPDFCLVLHEFEFPPNISIDIEGVISLDGGNKILRIETGDSLDEEDY